MTDDKEIKFHVLSDKETDQDYFGSHQKIADAIANLIENTDDGKSIALTGSWGSGKTSVIKMLEKKLLSISKDFQVFTFDAWSHEKDPLRRLFLENLRESNKWINNEDFKEDFERLAKRKETIRVRYRSSATCFGIFFAIFMLFMPIGFVILNNEELYTGKDYIYEIGIVLILLPFGLILFNVIWHFFCKIYKKIKRQKSISLLNRLSILSGSSIQDYKSDTSKTPDPTTIEFQELYHKILSKSLKKIKRKLIIVIDNLDRIDSDTARNIWSNLKIFSDTCSFNNNDWHKRLWLLVPFDPNHFKLVRKNGHPFEIDELIKKSFQLQYSVPPPILSNWVEFFQENLKEALPGLSDKKIQIVYKVYKIRTFGLIANRSPRSIKIFINRLGALYQQWHKEIDIGAIALYVTLNIENEFNLDKLATEDKSLINNISNELVGEDVFESLAAIFYNVPKKETLEIFLSRKIENSIKENNVELFKNLQLTKGFDRVLDHVIEQNCSDWVSTNTNYIAWVASILENYGSKENQSLIDVWNELIKCSAEVKKWNILDDVIVNGIQILLEKEPKEKFAISILKSISDIVKKDPLGIIPDEANSWLEGSLTIIKKIKEKHSSNIIKTNFRCKCDMNNYSTILAAALENMISKEDLSYYKSSIETNVIVGEFSKSIRDGVCSWKALEAFRIIYGNDWESDNIINTIEKRLNVGTNLEDQELESIITFLLEFDLDEDSKAGTILKKIAVNGTCFHFFYKTYRTATQLPSLCLYVILKYNPNVKNVSSVRNIANGVEAFNYMKIKPKKHTNLIIALSNIISKFDVNENLILSLKKDASFERLLLAIKESQANKEKMIQEINDYKDKNQNE